MGGEKVSAAWAPKAAERVLLKCAKLGVVSVGILDQQLQTQSSPVKGRTSDVFPSASGLAGAPFFSVFPLSL